MSFIHLLSETSCSDFREYKLRPPDEIIYTVNDLQAHIAPRRFDQEPTDPIQPWPGMTRKQHSEAGATFHSAATRRPVKSRPARNRPRGRRRGASGCAVLRHPPPVYGAATAKQAAPDLVRGRALFEPDQSVLLAGWSRAFRERPHAVRELKAQQAIVLTCGPNGAFVSIQVKLRGAPVGSARYPLVEGDVIGPWTSPSSRRPDYSRRSPSAAPGRECRRRECPN